LNLQLPVTLTFNNPPTTYSLTSANAAIVGGTTVTVASTANMAVGMQITGGGFPAGATITGITNSTTFVASVAAVPAAATGQTLKVGSFPYISGGVSLSNATVAGSTVTVASTANLVVGAPVSGGGFPAGTTVSSITNGTTFVTSAAAVPAAATAQSIQVGNTFNGWVAQISGSPAAGDAFTIGPNTNAVGDNRNALLMSGLQTQNLMANGTASFQGVYGQLVGEVGAKTSELSVTSLAQTNMVAQTVAAQQAVSGVNLDEEAANLIRYQKAYQAAAKAMQIANTLFDSILAIGR
jgi:flagellar hook-associated protein 1 FlgK